MLAMLLYLMHLPRHQQLFRIFNQIFVTTATQNTQSTVSRYRLDPGGELADAGPLCQDDPKEDSDENIIKLIQEKEKDLLLAAELGKALLDKNEEISHNRERIVLDYTQRLEVGQGRK